MGFRDGYGEKLKYNTTIRLKILERIQDRADKEGLPVNRLIEDALILLIGMEWRGIPKDVTADIEKGLPISTVCNNVASRLERFFNEKSSAD